MSMIQSKQRQLAIETTNQNIVVSASAGAGKTTLLIDRLMKRLMVDRLSVDQILALTFSEAAAAEMKERLTHQLTKQLQLTPDDFLQTQLSLLETAQISTIHSFCLSIIQDFSYVLNLDPQSTSNILDDASKESMQQACLDQVLLDAIENNMPHLKATIQYFSTKLNNLDKIKEIIKTIFKVRDAQLDPDSWDQKVLATYQNKTSLNDFDRPIKQAVINHVVLLTKKTMGIAERMAQYLADQQHDYLGIVEMIIDSLEEAIIKIKEADIDGFNQAIFAAASIKLNTIKKDDIYNGYRDLLYKSYEEIVPLLFSNDTLMNDISALEPIVATCLTLTKQFTFAYQQAKKEKLAIDYDDMERLAYQILINPDYQVAKIYAKRFHEIMVDEFQDTSLLQDAIITAVSSKNNIFRVGDVKQSIYRFRNAKPELMQTLMSQPDNMTVFLSNNFRSKKPIVDFNNDFFFKLFNINGYNNQYSRADWVEVGLEKQKEDGFPVEMLVVENGVVEEEAEESYDLDDEMVEDDQKPKQQEEDEPTSIKRALVIAEKVIELHTNHQVAFKDICILVRTHKTKQYIKEVFDQANIPCYIDTKTGFYQSHTVQDVLSVLRWCVNSNHDIALIGLLQSSLFQLTQDQIALMAIHKQKENLSWMQSCKQLYPTVYQQCQQLKQKVLQSSLVDALLVIYDFNDYYLLHQDQQGKTNLDFLLDKAANFKQGSILGFIKIVDQMQDEVSSEAIALGPDADVVKVMTIHQSKGLQFPVVFYWTSSRYSLLENTDSIMVDDELGIGLHSLEMPYRYKRNNLIRLAIKHKSQLQDIQEVGRLLYVALTRAQQRMYIIAHQTKKLNTERIDELNIISNLGTQDWLYPFFTHHPVLYKSISFIKPKPMSLESNQDIPKAQLKLTNSNPVETVVSLSTLSKPTLTLTTDLKPSEQGSLIHALLAHLIKNNWQSHAIDSHQSLLTIQQQQQVKDFINHPITKLFKDKPALVEMPILSKQGNQFKQNYLDLLIQFEDQWWIIDFKTDQLQTKEAFKERYQNQLSTYKQLVSKATNVLLKTYIYSLTLSEYIEVD